MESKKYRVRLVRPVFEIAVVEVQALNEEDAVLEALCQAESVPEEAWNGEFDPESYFYDVHYVQEVSPEKEDHYLEYGVEDDRRYLLLRGDIDSGTGAVPFQPWLSDISDLMVVDLCSDWKLDLDALERAGVASFFGAAGRETKT